MRTRTRRHAGTSGSARRASVGDVVAALTVGELPVRVTAYDGTALGPPESGIRLHIADQRGLAYLLTAPGDLGLARAYVTGSLELHGVHPGDLFEALRLVHDEVWLRRPSPGEMLSLARGLGWEKLRPPPPPREEAPPRWRRTVEGLRHSRGRDASAVKHHYDLSNTFYSYVLGPSMTYSCAVYRDRRDTLEEAQAAKYELIAQKLALRPGLRLLDVGCGWGGMARHAAREHGARVLGITLSREQVEWGQAAIERAGLSGLAEVRLLDYRDVRDAAGGGGFDGISSIGMAEHVGMRNFPTYFATLHSLLRPGGRLLNHCITRSDDHASPRPGAFIDRYVFPDGELPSPGRVVSEVHDVGLEVQHSENLRQHYALTLAAWGRNLAEHWDECVAEVGIGKSRAWGLYMAAARLSFEQNDLQVHQVLATKTEPGTSYPLRPDWSA